jgi:peptide/nickel transport system substrate-binding protein
MRGRGILAAAVILIAGSVSCSDKPPPTDRDAALRGGTLRVGMYYDPTEMFDPQLTFNLQRDLELLRCCLTRTLLSYNGRPTDQGGTQLRPDLAVALPRVSADGLTWTFTLRRGLRYAPPLQNTPIIARDIARGLERAMRRAPDNEFDIELVGGYLATFFAVVAGTSDYTAGRSRTITGIETPNDYTISFRLLQPTGDFGYRTALPPAMPIPPDPTGTRALGIAEGHDPFVHGPGSTDRSFGKFLVSSGPYMVEGSETINFSAAPADQRFAAGWRRDSVTFVRNPSWKSSTDPLRTAYADRIVFSTPRGEEDDQIVREVEAGDFDVVLDADVPVDVAASYRASTELRTRIFSADGDTVRFVKMNLAMPPFDDIHVRKAINYVIDKRSALEIQLRRGFAARITGHIGIDSELGNVLSSYDPYGTTEGPDLEAARREMALSRYDADRDGRCDVAACRDVRTVYREELRPAKETTASVGADLAKIGIHIRPDPKDNEGYFAEVTEASAHLPIAVMAGWGKDYPNASTFFPGLFGSHFVDDSGGTVLGATPGELRHWGYSITDVPSVNPQIRQCLERAFSAQTRCWVELDQHLMENVAPIVPLFNEVRTRVVSARVASFSFDQSISYPALDRIALKREARTSGTTGSPTPTGSNS